MAGNHVFGRSEHGTACMRCGYLSHVKEAGEECDGQYDERLIAEASAEIDALNKTLNMVTTARDTPWDAALDGDKDG